MPPEYNPLHASMYEVGVEYEWVNQTGDAAWMNGKSTVVLHEYGRVYCIYSGKHIGWGWETDTPPASGVGHVFAEPGDLRRKEDPQKGANEQSIMNLFNKNKEVELA